jgi:hypothetical protein
MSKAPDQLINWAQEIVQTLEDFVEKEGELEKIIQKTISEGKHVVEEEEHEIQLDREIEGDTEKIQSDLKDIEKRINKLELDIKKNGARPIQEEGVLKGIEKDVEDIINDIKEIESDLSVEKDEVKDEIRTVQNEAQEVVIGYENLKQGENKISNIDEMVSTLLETARTGQDQNLLGLANEAEKLRENIKQRIDEISKEEHGLAQEMNQQKDLMIKDAKINKQQFKELKQEMEEDKIIIDELTSLEEELKNHDDVEMLEPIAGIANQISTIEEHLENIAQIIEEIENAEENTARDTEDGLGELFR